MLIMLKRLAQLHKLPLNAIKKRCKASRKLVVVKDTVTLILFLIIKKKTKKKRYL